MLKQELSLKGKKVGRIQTSKGHTKPEPQKQLHEARQWFLKLNHKAPPQQHHATLAAHMQKKKQATTIPYAFENLATSAYDTQSIA